MAETPSSTVPNPRAPMTDEERRARYEFLQRRSMMSSIYAVHRNSDWVVRWVRDDKFDVPRHRHLGFEFAKDEPKAAESQRQVDTVVPLSEDGFYRTGDVILMMIPRIDYNFYMAENARQSKAMINAGKDGFKHEAAKHDFPTFERDKRGSNFQFHDGRERTIDDTD
jgi:hypothetical protein